jgi:uncharacterized protein
MEQKILFTSDLHGNINQYKLLLEKAREEKATGIIIGGDLCPTEEGIDINKQIEFINSTLPYLLKENKIPIYLMVGNDDVKIINEELEKEHEKLWFNINQRRISLGNFEIVGYPYIPISPFQVKDWEKFDILVEKDIKKGFFNRFFSKNELIPPGATIEGYISSSEEFSEIKLNKNDLNQYIEKDLENKIYIKNSKNTIYVFHSPPINTSLDMTYNLTHVGSKAIRKFIEQNDILIALSGHVHETVEMGKRNGKKYFEMINNNLCATAGNIHNYNEFSFSLEFSYLLFNPNNPKETLERKVINY